MNVPMDIESGPSKFDLMLALFEDRKIIFNERLTARINKLERKNNYAEDESWVISGTITSNGICGRDAPRGIDFDPYDFDAVYSLETRKGVLTPRN